MCVECRTCALYIYIHVRGGIGREASEPLCDKINMNNGQMRYMAA